MSSLVRRLQIRMLKRQGYRRTKFKVVKRPDGKEQLQHVSRGGIILDPQDKMIGPRWPRSVAA